MEYKTARRLSPKKLLLSKWTATVPKNKEMHFLVTQLIAPEAPETTTKLIEIEAVYSRLSMVLPWRELLDEDRWLQGWR